MNRGVTWESAAVVVFTQTRSVYTAQLMAEPLTVQRFDSFSWEKPDWSYNTKEGFLYMLHFFV